MASEAKNGANGDFGYNIAALVVLCKTVQAESTTPRTFHIDKEHYKQNKKVPL